jgi:sterol desaturase/sphingolipid hydroxylase (fatty acid hydroxylase superfamily)
MSFLEYPKRRWAMFLHHCLRLLDTGPTVTHVNRFWWATHVTHQFRKYNLSVARLGWTQHIKIIFFIPCRFDGVWSCPLFICHQIEVSINFGFIPNILENYRPQLNIFCHPSHHRVHHSSNDKYLDKNFGSTFIIWDRMFGTFQSEEEKPVYGITTLINSYNPILNFHIWKTLSQMWWK